MENIRLTDYIGAKITRGFNGATAVSLDVSIDVNTWSADKKGPAVSVLFSDVCYAVRVKMEELAQKGILDDYTLTTTHNKTVYSAYLQDDRFGSAADLYKAAKAIERVVSKQLGRNIKSVKYNENTDRY